MNIDLGIYGCLIILLSCGASSKEHSKISTMSDPIVEPSHLNLKSSSDYNFSEPSETHILDRKLMEISSLGYNPSNHTFLTNNDEKGHIYILNGNDFKIQEDLKFAKHGDYESIELIGNDIVVCKSSGTLYFYNLLSKETTAYKNEFKTSNDIEGLCYHKNSNVLLMACKGQPLDQKKGSKNRKCIYAFDLDDKKLNPEPYITIADEDLISYVDKAYATESKSKTKKLKNKAKDFAPSSIAIHPDTGDYYITSARGSSIVIFDSDKELKEIIFLNSKTIPQPEGITFDTQYNLYISTEGQGYSGKIFKFNKN